MIDTTLSSFERDVIEASLEVPVLLAFWAPWCAPCKAQAPLLERLERDYGGRFQLVNVNVDNNPEIVGSFEIKAIPHAVAFVHGNAVAQYEGAQPEAFIRAFLDRLIPDPGDGEHRSAREALVHRRTDEAEAHLRNALALDPSHEGARIDMASLLLDRGEVPAARSHFALLSPRASAQSTYAALAARMEAAEIAATLPPEDVLQRRLALCPGDLQSRLELAELHLARREYPPAMEQLLEVTRRDRGFRDDIGRRKLLEAFEMAAAWPELVADYRGRLSTVLF